MKRGLLQICCSLLILLFISAAACVAPPKSSGIQTTGAQGGASPRPEVTTVTTAGTLPIYVTIETPYGGTPQKTVIPTATTPPPEEWVEIFNEQRRFGYNATSFSFDLKNPPMLINVTLKPVNVTRKRVSLKESSSGSITETIEVSDEYSPNSWFEVTVRDKITERILLQDGFSNTYGKQYSQELNQTMKVIKKGILKIDIDGNLVTATVNVSVKKEGNLVNMTSA